MTSPEITHATEVVILDERTKAAIRVGLLSIGAFLTGVITLLIAPTGSLLVLVSGFLFMTFVVCVTYTSIALSAKRSEQPKSTIEYVAPIAKPKVIASEPVVGLLSSYLDQSRGRYSRH